MYYLSLHAAPPAHEREAGGAYVSCWVDAADAESAELTARRIIRERGWIPLEASEQCRVDRSEYEGYEGLAYYNSAVKDGACFAFNIYPPE